MKLLSMLITVAPKGILENNGRIFHAKIEAWRNDWLLKYYNLTINEMTKNRSDDPDMAEEIRAMADRRNTYVLEKGEELEKERIELFKDVVTLEI